MTSLAILLLALAQGAALLAQETRSLSADAYDSNATSHTLSRKINARCSIPHAGDGKEFTCGDWIHGGGWQVGDKSEVASKTLAFTRKRFVFVAVNYRFVPTVTIVTIVRDIAKLMCWVHDHVGLRGGDPITGSSLMGHSAGTQLAALRCTDDRFLKSEGLSLAILQGAPYLSTVMRTAACTVSDN